MTVLVSIQLLRGLAAILVAYIHAVQLYPGVASGVIIDEYSLLTSVGGSGVDLFFVISGFIVCFVSHHKNRSFSEFLVARFNRVVPIYWFWTSLFAFFMWVGSDLYIKDLLKIVCSYFFIPIMGLDGNRQPILSVGWTLNCEILFYLLFSFGFYMKGFIRNIFSVILPLFLAYVIYLGLYPIIILEFSIGVLIYLLWKQGVVKSLGTFLSLVLLFLGCFMLFVTADISYHTGGIYRLLLWGSGAGLIVLGLLGLEDHLKIRQEKLKLPILLGDSSYTLYLTHWFWGFVTYKIFAHFNFSIDVQVMATFLIMITSGVLFYIHIEKTILSKFYIRLPIGR